MRKIMNYLLSKLPIVKALNGKKTEIGFLLFLLGWIADGLAGASGFFPHIGTILDAQLALDGLYQNIVTGLENLGIGLAGVGVYHDKVKREADKDLSKGA